MRRTGSHAFLLGPLLSGVALWLSFPDFSLFPLAWVGLIPYLYFLLDRPSWRRTLAGHFIVSSLYLGGVLYWIPRVLNLYGGLSWPVALGPFLLMILALGLFLLPFSLLVRLVAARSGRLALCCAPGFWVLTELLRNYYAVNGFPWALLGYSQYPYLWLSQVADLSGVYLVSFLVVLANCAILGLLQFRSWRLAGVTGLLLAAANLYGVYRVYLWKPPPGAALQVSLVQPNIALAADREHYAGKYFEVLPDFYRRAVEKGARWVIFPEAQNPYSYQYDFYFKTFWERLVDGQGAYLLFNGAFFEEGPPARYFNSAILLNPEGLNTYRYDKIHLVPFGEYVPLERWLTFARPLVREVGAFSPGERFTVGEILGTRFGTLICYESIFPEMSRRLVREGAQLLVNLTNDSWFGQTAAPGQHLLMAAFRAIENRKPLLRCANGGYSAVINHLGQREQQLGLLQEGMIFSTVAGNSHRSLYSHIGEGLNLLIVFGSLVMGMMRVKEN